MRETPPTIRELQMTPNRPSSQRSKRRPASSGRKHPRRSLDRENREILLWAAEQLLREHGSDAVTVEAICALAKKSRASFNAVFTDRTDCLLGVFDELAERAERIMHIAYRDQESWLDGVRAALWELLYALQESPNLARFMVLGSAAGEPPMLARRARILAQLAEALEAEHPAGADGGQAAPFGAEAVVGAVAAILHARLLEDPLKSLTELAGPLMGVMVLPYLGAAAAGEEVSRPPPPRRSRAALAPVTGAPGPPVHAGVRLTLRTFTVLQAIAEHPGANNREVADHAGIGDPGQASRLLARLRGLGLIDSEQPHTRAPAGHSWRLTPAGRALLDNSRQTVE
jgi:AcrR family transcriptional regulator